MGGWSISALTFIARYNCEANILLISNMQVTFLYLVKFLLERGGYTVFGQFSLGRIMKFEVLW